MRPLVVTGCQRSGTAWIAAVVTACGHWASHERFFTEGRAWPLRAGIIEASWAAAGHLPLDGVNVIHQVRHPLDMVSSAAHRGTFNGKRRRSAKWAAKRVPVTFNESDDWVTRAVRYWVEWNRRCETHAQHRWRLEDITPADLAGTLTRFGHPVTEDRAAQAMAMVPPVNASDGHRRLGWDDLPRSDPKREARRMARRYGYDL